MFEAQRKRTMKTQIICPNKNDPAWKTLVKAIGEVRSYVAFLDRKSTPDAARARQLLKIKQEAGPKPNPPAAPVETGTPAIQLRRADTRKIKPGIFSTRRGGKLRSLARLQTSNAP